MWSLPRPGIELLSSTLAGEFLTTEPPGKPDFFFFVCCPLLLCMLPIVVVKWHNCVWLCNTMDYSTPGFSLSPSPGVCSNSCPLSTWCHPTISSSVAPFSSFLQSVPVSVFSSESALHIRWPKYWSFIFSISPSNEYSGFISFRIDWFDLLAVQGTFKSLLQHHRLKTSVLWHSTFFMVQISHPYMTTGKTIALTIWTFVSKVMSLLFNMLSRFFIAFLPRSKHLLILWLQLASAVILETKKIKSVTVSFFSHLFAMKWWDQMLWS